ncbi:MAG: STAS domain-containing protein [Chloroflexi bacterium]|nr:STAS domain-containing protein [Chloroflexota bacterium]
MEITTKRFERVDLISVSGRVDHQTAPELEKALRSILESGRHSLVVDLSAVGYVSSAGLKALQATAKVARGGLLGGDLRLAGLQPNIKEIFDTIGFTQLFKIYDSALDAVGSY